MKTILLLIAAAGLLPAQGIQCGTPYTQGDITVMCGLMPYKSLASLVPGVLSTAKDDAVQFLITCGDESVVAYWVDATVDLGQTPDSNGNTGVTTTTRLIKRVGPVSIMETPIADIRSTAVVSVRIRKLRADDPVVFDGSPAKPANLLLPVMVKVH